jgi:hypothetical protein
MSDILGIGAERAKFDVRPMMHGYPASAACNLSQYRRSPVTDSKDSRNLMTVVPFLKPRFCRVSDARFKFARSR